MWTGYDQLLAYYHNTMIIEWIKRGYKNTMKFLPEELDYLIPSWLGDNMLHSSHRSNLLRKDFNYYSKFG